MKKLLLTVGLVFGITSLNAQVITAQTAPNSISYNFTEANGWGPDLGITGNFVHDTLAVSADTLGCTSVSGVAGKIALIYRGSCNFSVKVENAQAAGAVGVIIVNNVPGAPIVMGGTPVGTVTIPVVMISQADGASLRAEMLNGPVKMYVGNKTGFFTNDIGFQAKDVLRAKYGGIPNTLAQNGTDFSVQPGAWVFNYGTSNQTGITLTATISNSPYSETTGPFDLDAGDSIYVGDDVNLTFSNYAPATWTPGSHTLSYTLNYGNTDGYTSDNTASSTFEVTSNILALARLTGGLPTSDGGSKSASSSQSFTSCLAFRDANASRIGMNGMYFSASTAATDSLDGLEVIGSIYKWDDVFTDLNDANFTITNYSEIAAGSYVFETNLQDSMVFMPLNAPIILLDNQRYLFCVIDYSNKIFFGYDSQTNYILNQDTYLQPLYPIQSDDTWYAAGFTGGPVPAIGINTFPADELNVAETQTVEASAFPIPAKDVITVKVNAAGDAALKVVDMAGRVVSTQQVKIENGQFNTSVAGMNAGTYVFTLDYSNGTTSRFNVVVSK